MTQKEIDILIEKVTKELSKDYVLARKVENNQQRLSPVFNQYKDELRSTFSTKGCLWWANVWDAIRKLTCAACGKRIVFDLKDDDNAEEICAKLIEYVLLLRATHDKNKEATA